MLHSQSAERYMYDTMVSPMPLNMDQSVDLHMQKEVHLSTKRKRSPLLAEEYLLIFPGLEWQGQWKDSHKGQVSTPLLELHQVPTQEASSHCSNFGLNLQKSKAREYHY